MASACRPEELFTLDIVAHHLMGFQPPQGPHNPAGDWQLDYGLYSVAAQVGFGSRVGTVRVSRKCRGREQFTLQVECRKSEPGRVNVRFAAQVEAGSQRLPAPLRWSWQQEIVDADGKIMPESRLERSASMREGAAVLAGPRRKLAVSGPCTLDWLLFDAVGRLPREPFPPLDFTLLDGFDRVKPDHTLCYARSATVMLGDRKVRQTRVEQLEKGRIHKTAWVLTGAQPVRLHVYHHLGDGSVPWLYWVDDQGRLLFAVSGIEAYLLDSFARS